MSFGWAYVDCSGVAAGGQAAGPTGSLQFLTGTNSTSGSANLIFHTAAFAPYSANTLVLTGTLVIDGVVSASHYHIQNVVEMDVSGNTFFGNTDGDIHGRTGSLSLANVAGQKNLDVNTSGRTTVKHLRVDYTSITSSVFTASVPGYIFGVQVTGNVQIRIPDPSAASVGAGTIFLVKDELVSSRGGNNITISAAGSGKLIDGASSYVLTGTMPAISLYSNGTNWFVF